MLFFVALLAVSWLIIYLLEKRNLLRQWTLPFGNRLREGAIGLVVAATAAMATNLFLATVAGSSFALNPESSFGQLLRMLRYDLASVLVEELVFRGVPLYLLIKYFRWRPALFMGAAAFGIYHWFTFGVLGSAPAMVVVFIVTGLMGYVFGLAYYRTSSLLLPIGIHLGWNVVVNTLLPLNSRAGSLFIVGGERDMAGWGGLLSVGMHLLVAALLLYFVHARFPARQSGNFNSSK
jgi:membrane protease YdiL (CAAX protease family)